MTEDVRIRRKKCRFEGVRLGAKKPKNRYTFPRLGQNTSEVKKRSSSVFERMESIQERRWILQNLQRAQSPALNCHETSRWLEKDSICKNTYTGIKIAAQFICDADRRRRNGG